MKYFSGSGRRRTVRKSVIWMKSRVRPRLASRTVSTGRESPGTKRSSPIRSSGPLGMSRMPVASTTRTPGWPSANRAYQSRTSCVTNPSSVARHGTIAGTHVRSAATRRVPSVIGENQREPAASSRVGHLAGGTGRRTRFRSGAVTLTGPPGSRQAGDAVDLEHAPVGRVVEVARPDQRHRGEVSAEVLAVHPADRLAVSLVEVGVEHVDRELDHVGELAARGGDDRAEVLAHLAELGDQVARADDPPLLVLRDLTRDEQEPPAARLGAVGVADGSRERRRVVELDPLRHGLLPSRTIVSPLVAASSSRVETAAATSAGSMSRPPGLIRAMARTASSNDLPVFAAMLRAAVHTRSVPV